MTIERRRLLYDGRVQGVGFRMTARRLASAFAISGFVRNLHDGRVELVVEGDSGTVAAYLNAVLREFGDMIRDIAEDDSAFEHENQPFSGFTIRY
jgi:acylphosphatase